MVLKSCTINAAPKPSTLTIIGVLLSSPRTAITATAPMIAIVTTVIAEYTGHCGLAGGSVIPEAVATLTSTTFILTLIPIFGVQRFNSTALVPVLYRDRVDTSRDDQHVIDTGIIYADNESFTICRDFRPTNTEMSIRRYPTLTAIVQPR